MPIAYGTNPVAPKAKKLVNPTPAVLNQWVDVLTAGMQYEEAPPELGEGAVQRNHTGWRDLTELIAGKGLFILNPAGKRIDFCDPLDINRDPKLVDEQLQDMLQASVEGRLFARHKDTGRIMQVQTTRVDENNCMLKISKESDEIPEVHGDILDAAQPMPKPKKPSFLTRFLAFFRVKEARAEVEAYDHAKERYDAFKEGSVNLPPKKEVDPEAEFRTEEEQPQNDQDGVNAGKQEPERSLKPYHAKNIQDFNSRMLNATFMNYAKAPKDGPVQPTLDQFAVLAIMAIAAEDMEITAKQRVNSLSGTETVKIKNNPEKDYVKALYNDFFGNQYDKHHSSIKAFENEGGVAVNRALRAINEEGDYKPLAQILGKGLLLNNKQIRDQRTFSDWFNCLAMVGHTALSLINSNEQLKQEVMKVLGDSKKEIDTATAAKNISDLRAEAMILHKDMVFKFGAYNPKGDPLNLSTNKALSTVCQFCALEVDLASKKLDFANTKYVDSKYMHQVNDMMADDPMLEAFRGRRDNPANPSRNREAELLDPVKMTTFFGKAINRNEQMSQIQKDNVPQNQMENIIAMN